MFTRTTMTTTRSKFTTTVVVAVVVVVAVLGAFALGRGSQQTAVSPTTKTTSSKTPPATKPTTGPPGQQWVHVPPASVTPANSVAQRTMDAAFKSDWNSQVLSLYDATPVPSPGFAAGYHSVPIAWSPDAWLRTWTAQFLTIDFAHQTRAGLAQWMSATRAAYDVPGLSTAQKSKALFALALDRLPFAPSYASGIPHPAAWAALAAAGTTWTASNITNTVTAFWAKVISAGWQPTDQRMATYNVTGTLTSTTGGVSTVHTFTAAITLGSGWWQQGYGTAYFSKFSAS